jgi:hypothetical protein
VDAVDVACGAVAEERPEEQAEGCRAVIGPGFGVFTGGAGWLEGVGPERDRDRAERHHETEPLPRYGVHHPTEREPADDTHPVVPDEPRPDSRPPGKTRSHVCTPGSTRPSAAGR